MRYDKLLTKANIIVGAKTSAPTIDEMVISEIKDATRKAIQEIIPSREEISEIVKNNTPATPTNEQLSKMLDDAVAKHIPVKMEASSNTELNDKVNQMMQIMKELSEKDNSAPANFDSYSLNDDEITQVLTWLLNYQEKYFPNTPLSETLHQDFMWNIPKEIYDAAYTAEMYGYPDVLNPIFWFYMFCMENPHDMIGEFIINAVNTIDDDAESVIANHAKEYRRVYFEEEEPEVTSSEVTVNNTGVSTIEDFDPEISVETVNEEE